MKRSSTLKPSKTPMARVKPLPGILRTASLAPKVASGKRKSLKSKQRAVTKAEKAYWSRLANEVGCIACRLDGLINQYVSIHHVDGRTKPGCHLKVLPLCAGHHQDGTGQCKDTIAVHPYKARFESRYGSQIELIAKCNEILGIE